jgi:6-phosphogluconolactonase (cycloisomerase 2 family)
VYITDRTLGTVTACTADGTTGALGNCAAPVAGFANPTDATVSGSNLFVTNFGNNSVSRCAIGTDGSLSGCTNAGAASLNQPTDIVVNGNTAYVVNYGASTVSRCSVDASTGVLSACADSGASGLTGPIGMDIKGNVAYLSNINDNSVSQCSIDTVTGNLSCPTNKHFNSVNARSPYSLTVNGNYLYIVNQGVAPTPTTTMTQSSITRCNINATTGDLDSASCAEQTGLTVSGVSATDWFQFNRIAIRNNTAYITARSIGKVIQCSVDATTGALSACSASTPALSGATGIAIK